MRRYTYLHVRMAKNPLNYALTWADVAADPQLLEHRRKLVRAAWTTSALNLSSLVAVWLSFIAMTLRLHRR